MKKCYYFLICLLAFLFTGCESSEGTGSVTSEITIPSQFSTILLDSDDLSQTITFVATTDWAITLSETTKAVPDWITVSPMSGVAGSVTLSVTLDENKSLEDRYTDLIITTSRGEERISITQAAFEPILSLDPTSKSVTCDSDSFSAVVTSNLDWEASDIPDWITLTATSGSGDQTITFSYTENTTVEERSATIKISATEYEQATEIKVTQAAFEPILSLNPTSESVSCTSGSFSVEVTSNLDWETSDIPDWITLTSTNGSGDQTITFSYTENTTVEERSATIKISATEYEQATEIKVTQAAFEPILSLNPTSESVSCTSGSFSVEVTSNLDWETSDIPDWITLTSTNGSGDQTITFSYTENTTVEERSATIKFSNATYSNEAEIVVVQAASQLSDLIDGGSL